MQPAPGNDGRDAERLLEGAGWVRRLALGLCGDVQEAEDLVQDALVVALERKGPALRRTDDGALGAWFAGVLRNLAWKRRRGGDRRRRREAVAASVGEEPPVDELYERVSLHQAVVQAVMRLDEPYRAVIVLRYLDELPPRAIAKRLGVPVNTVRTRIQRGLARLRAALDERAGGREEWFPGLLALCGRPGTVGTLAGATLMATKVKVAAVVVVAAAGIWWGWRLLAPGSVREPGELAGVAARPLPAEDAGERAGGQTASPATDVPGRVAVSAAGALPRAPELSVRVVALETEEPLAGVYVELRDPDAEPTGLAAHWTATDADGSARFTLEAGRDFTLVARSPAWLVREDERPVPGLAPGETRLLELALATEPDATYFGRVVDARSGAPLEDALVRLDELDTWHADDGAWRGDGARGATSGADGLFELPIRSWRPAVLRVRRAGFGEAMVALSPTHSTPLDPQLVRLEPAGAFELLISGRGGAPVTGLRVHLSVGSQYLLTEAGPWNFRWSPDPCWETTSDEAGAARLAGLPARVPLVARLLDGERTLYESEPVRIAPGETERLRIDLDPVGSIGGRVVDAEGSLVAGIEVWLIKGTQGRPGQARFVQPYDEAFAKARSDEHGEFVFEDVEEGAWTVGPAAVRRLGMPERDDLVAGLAQQVMLGPDARTVQVTLEVFRGLYLRGRTVGADGQPVIAATVFATCSDAFGAMLGTSGPDGRFALGPLVPGDYGVQGRANAGGHTTSVPVSARPGDEIELVFAAGGTVSGRVLRAAGQEDVGFWIAFQPADGQGLPSSWSSLEETDERFRRAGLSPGVYNLIARTHDGAVGVQTGVTVQVGLETSGIEIPVTPGAGLAVVVESDAESLVLELWRDELFLGRGYFAPGEAWRERLPAGPVTVKCLDRAGAVLAVEELVLTAGEERELLLRPEER